MSLRFIRQSLFILLLAAFTTIASLAIPSFANASDTYFYTLDLAGNGTKFTAANLACQSVITNPLGVSARPLADGNWLCVVGCISSICDTTRVVYRHVQLVCEPPSTIQNGVCVLPTPTCPDGATWDPFSEPPRCTFPQDDACGAIGAHWDLASTSCQCDSETDALVTAGGISRCMKLRDDSCTKDSPDFKGYAGFGDSVGQAICDGRASCPDGGTPGYVGSGDTMTAICYQNEKPTDEECNGTVGVLNGVKICVPKPGTDPDFPDCSGVVGVVNGVKQCIHKPTDHPGCKPGETAGYAGSGADMNFTCVPADYKPETCPPGQYVTNSATGGFGCAKADGQQKPGEDGKVPGKATGTPGKSTGSSTTTKKDAEGNVTGTEESEIKLDFTDLLQDQPSTDYKAEMDAFSDSELDGLDIESLAGEFDGADGAFTERNSLNNIGNFLKSHTVGTSTNCTGSLPFFGRVISCEKFATYNRIIGWMIFIYTLIHIYNVVMRKSESGV
jgi:hypothetical protein